MNSAPEEYVELTGSHLNTKFTKSSKTSKPTKKASPSYTTPIDATRCNSRATYRESLNSLQQNEKQGML